MIHRLVQSPKYSLWPLTLARKSNGSRNMVKIFSTAEKVICFCSERTGNRKFVVKGEITLTVYACIYHIPNHFRRAYLD